VLLDATCCQAPTYGATDPGGMLAGILSQPPGGPATTRQSVGTGASVVPCEAGLSSVFGADRRAHDGPAIRLIAGHRTERRLD